MSDRDKDRRVVEAYQKGLDGEYVRDGLFTSPTHEEKIANRRGREEKSRLDEVERRREETRTKRREEKAEAREARQAEREENRKQNQYKHWDDRDFTIGKHLKHEAERLARVNPLPLTMIRAHRVGEIHQLYRGKYYNWRSHPDGVMISRAIQRGGEDFQGCVSMSFFLNGRIDCGGALCSSHKVHPDSGIPAQRLPELLWCPEHNLRDKDVGYIKNYWPHPQGVVVQIEDRLLLNGTTEIFRGQFDEIKYHPLGIALRVGDKILLDGKQLLYQGPMKFWEGHQKGIVIQNNGDLLLNGITSLSSGLSDWTTWESHPEGVVIQKDNRLLLNGERVLFEGDFDDWGYHPRGALVRIEDSFLLV